MQRPYLPSELERGYPAASAIDLYNQGHYYLLERLHRLGHLAELPVPLEELMFREWEQWREISPLIAFHCGRRLIKSVRRKDSHYLEMEKFIAKWSTSLGKKKR